MRFNTRTEYGLICLIYMSQQKDRRPITPKEIAADEKFSLTFTEKILQKLRAAKIVEAHHGHLGGYVLARDPSQITLKEIVEAFEGHTFDVFCEPKVRKLIICNHFHLCGVKPIWHRTKELLDQYYGSVTLDKLASNEIESPLSASGEPV